MPTAGQRSIREPGATEAALPFDLGEFFFPGLLSGSKARLGLWQQEKGDAQQRDDHPDPRRLELDWNRSDLDERRNAVAARHLMDEIGREAFVHQAPAPPSVKPLGHPCAGGQAEADDQRHRPDRFEPRAEVETPDADWVGNGDDSQKKKEVERAEPVIAPGVDAARIMMLQPIGPDHDIAENQGEMLTPLLGHRFREVSVAVRAIRRSGDLDLHGQQGQRDRENRVAEPFEAIESALGAVGLGVRELGHQPERLLPPERSKS